MRAFLQNQSHQHNSHAFIHNHDHASFINLPHNTSTTYITHLALTHPPTTTTTITQVHLLARLRDAAEGNLPSLRRCTGVQSLLDLLRLHVCSPHLLPPGVCASLPPSLLDGTEQALLVEMCEPLITAVAEAGLAARQRAEEKVMYYEAHPTRVALALMDEAGGGGPMSCPCSAASTTTAAPRRCRRVVGGKGDGE